MLTDRQLQEGSDSNPPSHAPTPTASFAPPLSTRASDVGTSTSLRAANKKKRPQEKDDEDDSKVSKRGKITYARD